jgi:hypothetical protein
MGDWPQSDPTHILVVPLAHYTRHRWLRVVIKDLETNPHSQYKVHLWGMWYWVINFPLVTALFFFAPGLWIRVGLLVTLIYSIYANFATDYGAMSAAMAAYGVAPLPVIPGEPSVDAVSLSHIESTTNRIDGGLSELVDEIKLLRAELAAERGGKCEGS